MSFSDRCQRWFSRGLIGPSKATCDAIVELLRDNYPRGARRNGSVVDQRDL
jgi:hypothetical protein